MPRVRFLGFPHPGSYRGSHPGAEEAWERLAEREVPEETAVYLCETFPGAFERVASAKAVASPVHRMALAPAGKGAETAKHRR